jgi:PAS domain S-box-containing protein
MDEFFVPAERLRHIEADGLFGTWEWDFATGAITWSDGVFRVLGLEPRSVAPSYRAFLELMHPEDRFGYELSGYDAVLEGRTVDSEFRIVRPDGSIRWLANKGEIFRDGDGQPCRAAGALIDITAQREAQDALKVSEERYRALVRATAVAEWRTTPDGLCFEATNWFALTGQPEAECKRLGWMEMVHPEDRERLRSERERGLRSGAPFEISYRLRCSGGAYRWVLGRAVPLTNPDGSIREWVGMIMDVHEGRSAEERLRIGEERLRVALESGRIIAWEYELGGHIVACSDNATDIVGLGSSPVKDVLERIHPEDRPRVEAAWNRALVEDTPCDIEFRFFRPDGRMIRLAVKGSVLRNLSTVTDRFVGIAFDITAEKEAERHGSATSARGEFGAHPPPEPGPAAERSTGPSVTFQLTRLATRRGGEEACLVHVGNRLAAVLVHLDGTAGEEHEDTWFLEVGFGPWDQQALIFATWVEAEDWIRARLPPSWHPD